MDSEEKRYSNGEITVVWKQSACIHSKECWKNLRNVFDPFKRPWVNIQGDTSEKIMAQVDKCPSKALSYFKEQQ